MAHDDPISYKVLREGVDVMSSDGERVGAVEHVLADEPTGIFDGIVIDTRFGPGGWRFVDAPQIAEIREDAVLLTIPVSEVEQLHRPEANPAVVKGGEEELESRLAGKLRRAWDLISRRT